MGGQNNVYTNLNRQIDVGFVYEVLGFEVNVVGKVCCGMVRLKVVIL